MKPETSTKRIDNKYKHPVYQIDDNFSDIYNRSISEQESDMVKTMNEYDLLKNESNDLETNKNNLEEMNQNKPKEQAENENKLLRKKRNREKEEDKNSTENENKFDINETHKSPKEEAPKHNIIDEESENNSDLEYIYKSQIYQILITLVENDNKSDFFKIMSMPFKNILNPKNQENFSFLEQTLLKYSNEFFESIQKNNKEGNIFKKKERNVEQMFDLIKALNDIIKEKELKKEKEKEEKKETKEYIINESITTPNDELINENSDFLLNIFQSMSEHINPTIPLDKQKKTDYETKQKKHEFKDKNINGKIKTRIINDLKEDFNKNAETMGFFTGNKKDKIKLKTIKNINKNNHLEDLKFLELQFRDIIFEKEKIDFSKEGQKVQDLLDTKIGEHLQKIMEDEDKKVKFINSEKENNIQHQKSDECRKIIYEIMKTKNLDGLILLLMTDIFIISKRRYIKFPKSTKEFEALIKNLKQYKDLNLDLIINEYKKDIIVQNFRNVSQDFENYLN